MDDFVKHREDLKAKIVEEILTQFEAQKLDREELATLSQYLLDNFDKQADPAQLTSFMNELAEALPFFKNLAQMETGDAEEEKDKDAAQKVLQLLQTGQAAQAAAVGSEANK